MNEDKYIEALTKFIQGLDIWDIEYLCNKNTIGVSNIDVEAAIYILTKKGEER